MTALLIKLFIAVALIFSILIYYKIIGWGFLRFIFCILLGLSLLYGGGWDIVWGENMLAFEVGKEIANLFNFELATLVFQVNHEYYGLMATDRFFYSPFLSWIAFGASLTAFYWALTPRSTKATSTSE